MGRLKHYHNCEAVIVPNESAPVIEDEMVHEELKKSNVRNELGRQNNGKRFLTDKEIKVLVEQFVKDDEVIAQTYEEIAKRRKDKNFQYSLVKQGVSMTIVSRFCEMGIARPSAMKLAMGVVNILYDLYVAGCQTEAAKKEEKVVDAIGVPDSAAEEHAADEKQEKSVGECKPEQNSDAVPGIPEKLQEGVRKIVVSPKSISLEDAVIEAGKIKSLMEMMDSYYYDYLSPDASEKMQSFYCVFDILKKRYEEFEDGLQHVIYG